MLRVMVFIDGSNIFHTVKCFRPDFRVDYQKIVNVLTGERQLIRIYYFGAEEVPPREKQSKFHEKLQSLGMTVIIRPLQMRNDIFVEKGVDVALVTEMLYLGLRNAYDVAILVSGDSDYIGTVQKLKSEGKIVEVAAFNCGIGRDLRLAADTFVALDDLAEFIEQKRD